MHNYLPELAAEYGLDIAVFMTRLSTWIYCNYEQEQNIIDGQIWARVPVRRLVDYFDIKGWTTKKIRCLIDKCLELKLIEKRKFDIKKSDHTCFYSIVNVDEIVFNKSKPASRPHDHSFAPEGNSWFAPEGNSSLIYTEKETKKKTSKNLASKNDANFLSLFVNKLIKEFPKKGSSRKETEKIIKKLKPDDITQQRMLRAIRDQIMFKEREKELTGFTPTWKHLKTWLNNECWTLELEDTSAQYIPAPINPNY